MESFVLWFPSRGCPSWRKRGVLAREKGWLVFRINSVWFVFHAPLEQETWSEDQKGPSGRLEAIDVTLF